MTGQNHPKAKLSDEQVKQMRERYAYGRGGIGYLKLSRLFHCGVSTARDICTYRTRV